jgi:hypothetical protein
VSMSMLAGTESSQNSNLLAKGSVIF